jgi:hypothetical protein
MELLDPKLQRLDILRITYKVHIDWDANTECLRLNAMNPQAAANITAAIKGIRQAYQDAKAQAISASPLYIIVPPTASAMRSIVRLKTLEYQSGHYRNVATSIELVGEPLSASETLKWEATRRKMIDDNFNTFRDHLIKRTLPLADLKGWMRMRVHLGHINLREYPLEFRDSNKYSFDMFTNMMKKSRVSSSATFDRK